MSSICIEVKNLSKYYQRQAGWFDVLRGRAVDNVSLTIGKGEIVGLVGESGSGKTTLARTMLRLCEPTAGEVWYGGQNLFAINQKALKSLRQRLQIVFQDAGSALDPRFTVEESLAEPLLVHGFPAATRRKRLEAARQQTGISRSLLGRRPVELSGGQRQRVCLARAIALQPEFLVLDEPLAGLDASVKAQILQLLLDLRSELGIAYLLISHDVETTLYASDRIAVMRTGRLVANVLPQDWESSVVGEERLGHGMSVAELALPSDPGGVGSEPDGKAVECKRTN